MYPDVCKAQMGQVTGLVYAAVRFWISASPLSSSQCQVSKKLAGCTIERSHFQGRYEQVTITRKMNIFGPLLSTQALLSSQPSNPGFRLLLILGNRCHISNQLLVAPGLGLIQHWNGRGWLLVPKRPVKWIHR